MVLSFEMEAETSDSMGHGDVPDISKFLSINMDEGDSFLNLNDSCGNDGEDASYSLPDSVNSFTFCETTLTPVVPHPSVIDQPQSFSDFFSRFGPSNGKLCHICDRYFSKHKFSAHVRTHTGEKPFICEFCNRGFARSDKLKYHRRVHTGEKPFSCFCGKRFARMDHMKNHTASHSVPTLKKNMLLEAVQFSNCTFSLPYTGLQCPICPARFPGKYKLERHIRTHTGDKPYKCDCGMRFTRLEHLKKHQIGKSCPVHAVNKGKNLEDNNSLDVPYVDAPSKTETNIKKDLKIDLFETFQDTESLPNVENLTECDTSKDGDKKHNKRKLFVCEFCNKVFAKGHKLNIHRRIHTGEKPYPCETCGKGFARKDHLLKHLNVHLKYRNTMNESANFSGGFENSLESILSEIQIKQEVLDPSLSDSLYQELRENGFENLFNPEAAEATVKTEIEDFNCNICNLSFSSNYFLQVHMQAHINKTIYTCDICFREFKVKKNYEAHMLNHETKGEGDGISTSPELETARSKRVQCPQCNKWLVSPSSLEMHLRSHTGEKPHQCDFCEKVFVRKADMVRHRKVHTGESMYTCPLCSSSYTRRDKLALHIKKNHEEKLTRET